MTEVELIELLTRNIPRHKGDLKIGIGDDCSVIRAGKKDILISCDSLVEDIHFKRKWASWDVWGAKIAAAALSDIAAKGGKPCYAWVNLSIPKNVSAKQTQTFYNGLLKILKKFKTTIAGGNITKSPKGFSAILTVWGEIASGKAMLRDKAKGGDTVYVSGVLGKNDFVKSPHIKLGQWLVKKGCRCAIDVSDGLLKDLGHIAKASKVKIVLNAEKLPHEGPLKKALTRGEDYVLAFTGRLPYSNRYHMVGEVKKGSSCVQVVDSKGNLLSFPNSGFDHRITG
ncbi:MAG: hypothetical protein A2W61_07510 [Deltaproteobacteria bacterium RIFCSPLOWO2_01_44_7]|nr:MAG: hypothetical protein A2712_08630 [Deltaproteobacteria bacterium RIFCSPHIGHO2_01_FULL_43_49]OGQ14597.1 MAG: hypothetical protein A3D22_08370 [Deltaproteobacteria bacterium RIFCSPHIGHO2_02_FULL_44_53]OGQ27983.1 MAG: hypothetical protein A3D98_07080 [Deltaproteobacteria bacterium RIFCSPHIGHO2_12_FULL_44_21]OGQ31195.1 MAG: hypothetical protein A2979_07130 [Deltaproteobacteria bacterium RIFCSPLOWO2_01_FULL_45_74]OGQ37977.1 MAG: hypothetical protein A2W61_07510 [Deltaproteobacteria bacterium 